MKHILASIIIACGIARAEDTTQSSVVIGPVTVTATGSSTGQGKPARTAYLGVVTSPLSPQLRAQLDLPEGMGLSVEAVAKDSPAEKAGIKQYDVLKKFNDQMLCAAEQLSVLVKSAGKGAKVLIVVLRGGREENITVALGEHDEPETGRARFSINGVPGLNIEVQDIEKMLKEAFSDNSGAKSFGFTIPGGSGGGSVHVFPGGAANGADGIQKKMEELRKKHEQRQKQFEDKAGAANNKVQEDAAKNGAGATAQAFSFYPDAQTSSVVTIVDSDGTVEVKETNGRRTVKISDPSGKELYSGPLNNEDDRAAVPEKFRGKVKNTEGKIKTPKTEGMKLKPMKKMSPPPAKGDSI